MSTNDPSTEKVVAELQPAITALRERVTAAIVGHAEAIEQFLVALLAGGHVLLGGPPGVGKSLLLASLAAAAGLRFRRVEFTPDLMLGDLASGAKDFRSGEHGEGRTDRGPLFAELLLADEFERASPRTRAAVLQAVDDGQVLVQGAVYALPRPRMFVATRNPLEAEIELGLSQAQRDRFLLDLRLNFPSPEEEWEIVERAAARPRTDDAHALVTPIALADWQTAVAEIRVGRKVMAYAAALVRASRPGSAEAAASVDKWVAWGAGPRGLVALTTAARARALVNGRAAATIDDVIHLAPPVLRHRIEGNDGAKASGLTSDQLVRMLLEAVPPDGDYPMPPAVSRAAEEANGH